MLHFSNASSLDAMLVTWGVLMLTALAQCFWRRKRKEHDCGAGKPAEEHDPIIQVQGSLPTRSHSPCDIAKNVARSFSLREEETQELELGGGGQHRNSVVNRLDGGEKAERIWADKDGEKDKHFERSQRENEKLETNEKVKNGNNNEIRRCGRLEGKVARCIETHKRVEKVTEEKETKQEIEESIKLIGKPLSERKKDTWIKANPRAQPIPPKSESKEEIHDERPNRATQSESASDPIPEPLSDARTQQSRTVIIQSDDDTTKHVESLKESMSD